MLSFDLLKDKLLLKLIAKLEEGVELKFLGRMLRHIGEVMLLNFPYL